MLEGVQKSLLVHRKGSTRAFPPHHPLIPVDYQVNHELTFEFKIVLYLSSARVYNEGGTVIALEGLERLCYFMSVIFGTFLAFFPMC